MITIPRRRLLQVGTSAFFGALVARFLEGNGVGPGLALADAPKSKTATKKANACILIWLNGGPSHLDSFDPKPGRAVSGPFKAIATRAAGVQICEHLPRLAEQAASFALVRGMTSKEGNHQRAQYLVHTGYAPNPTVHHPSLGGWSSSRLGDSGAELPAFVSIGGPSEGAGFLGVEHNPFVLRKAGALPPNVEPAPGISDTRFARRRVGLDMLESHFAAETGDSKVDGRRAVYAKATKMMGSQKLKNFDLSGEPRALVQSYGETDFGRACMLARRLVTEGGVKFVEVVLDGWDTHVDGFTKMKTLLGTLDAGLGSLLADLRDKKVLDSTLVACMGEFGRTPRINANDGRDHHPNAWSALLAGGGIRGGIAHGATDADGTKVVSGAVSVPNLMATMATVLGMDPGHTQMTPIGRPISLTDNGTPVKEILV